MWHLQTKFGTFWIVDSDGLPETYVLGMDNDTLGVYPTPDKAVQDVQRQETGCLRWDTVPLGRNPPDLNLWREGSPEHWE